MVLVVLVVEVVLVVLLVLVILGMVWVEVNFDLYPYDVEVVLVVLEVVLVVLGMVLVIQRPVLLEAGVFYNMNSPGASLAGGWGFL